MIEDKSEGGMVAVRGRPFGCFSDLCRIRVYRMFSNVVKYFENQQQLSFRATEFVPPQISGD